MAKLTINEAAEATGKSRQTIWRATESGKLSFEKNEQDVMVIDAAELTRVYPISKAWLKKQEGGAADVAADETEQVADATDGTPRNGYRNSDLATELKFIRERMTDRAQLHERELAMLNARIEELRADKDGFARERDSWVKEREGLITTLKEMGTAMRLLTDQRPAATPSAEPAPIDAPTAAQAGRRGMFGWFRR